MQNKLQEVFKDVQRKRIEDATPQEINERVALAMSVMSTEDKGRLLLEIAKFEKMTPENKARTLGMLPKKTIASRVMDWIKR